MDYISRVTLNWDAPCNRDKYHKQLSYYGVRMDKLEVRHKPRGKVFNRISLLEFVSKLKEINV